jgi:outer membrane protein assembly factor BamA
VVLLLGAAAAAFRPVAIRLIAAGARRHLEAGASPAMGTTVGAGAIEVVGLSPVVIVFRDVRAEGAGPYGLAPGARADVMTLRASPLALARWGRHPVDLLVEGARLEIDLPRAAAPATGPATSPDRPPAAWPPRSTLRVRGGVIDFTAPGVAFACAGLGLDAGPGSGAPIAGRLMCPEGRLSTPLGVIEALSGQAGFAWSPGRLGLDPLILHGEGIDLAGRAGIDLPDAARLAGAAGTTGTGELSLGFDLARLAPYLPPVAAPGGRVETRLRGTYAAGVTRAEGTLEAPLARLYGVEAAEVKARLTWDGTLRLDDVRARTLGGEVRGGLSLRPRPGGYTLEAQVGAEGLEARSLLALAEWPGPDVTGRIAYAGRHTMDERGPVSLAGGGDLTLAGTLNQPGRPTRPIAAEVRVATHGTALTLSDGHLTAGSVEAHFDGRFDPVSGLALRLRGASGALGDLLPLFAPRPAGGPRAALAPAPAGPLLPVRLVTRARAPATSPLDAIVAALGGRWEWDGDLRVDRSGPRFDGTVRGRDLRWHDAAIGDLDAEVHYRGERLTIDRMTVRTPGGGTATITGGVDFRAPGRLDLRSEFADVAAPLLLALAGFDLEVTGTVSGRAEVTGSLAAPEFDATIAAAPLAVAGVTLDDVAGGLTLREGVLAARDLRATLGQGTLRGDGGLAIRTGAQAPGLTIEVHEIDLARCTALLGGAPLAGLLSGSASLEGALAAPGGAVRLSAREIRHGDLSVGDMTIEADLIPGTPRSTAEVRAAVAARSLTAAGTIGLGGDWPIDLEVAADDLTLRGVQLAEGIPEEVAVTLGGRARLTGPGARPRAIEGNITLTRAGLTVGAASAMNEQPVEAILESGGLVVRPAVLAGPGTRVELEAGLDLDPLGTVRLEARGRFDLALLRSFVRGLQAEGQGDLGLSVSGLRRDPAFRGTLVVRAPRIRYGDLPFPIDEVDGTIAFDGISARIESLRFKAGGGPVEGAGEALIGKSGLTRGLADVLAADITLKGNGVRATFPPGLRSLSDVDLRLVYDPTGAELSGEVDFVRGVYDRDFRIESSILRGRGVSLFDLGEPSGPLAALRLDLALRADDQLWLRNDFGRIEGQVDLRVTGTAGRPSVAGRITALEGSTIDFNRVRYRLVSGTIDFNDPEVINPYFNLIAETTVGEYSITLRVEGTADDFRYDLASNPSLPEADIVALLITGQAPSTIGSGTSTFSADNVSAYLAGQFTQQVSSRFLGRVAPDMIAIDPLSVIAQEESATRVTLAKQITSDLRVTYSDLLGGSAGASYQLDYSLARYVGFSSVRDTDGSIGGDFRFTVPGHTPVVPGDASADEAVKPRIRRIEVTGDPVLEPKRILRKLRLDPGDRRDRAKLYERLEKLMDLYHREGYLSAEVDIDETPAGEGLVDLTVMARAGPRLSIEIDGVRGRREIKAAIQPLWEQSLFFEDTLEASRVRIETIVRDRGWRGATVTAALSPDPRDGQRAVFTVNRGERTRASAVRVVGARWIETATLEGLLKTHRDSAFRRGIVRGDHLRDDVAALQGFLLGRGFPRSRVESPRIEIDEATGKATVTFEVHEGPHVTIAGLQFEGDNSLPSERLIEAAALEVGGPFVRAGADAAAARIRRAYDESGWPEARVNWMAVPVGEATGEPAATEPVDGEAGALETGSEADDIIFNIEEGRRQRIESIAITGNMVTDDTTIRRALRVDPYDPLSRADLLRSQTNLYRLGVFRSVEIRPDRIPESEAVGPAAPGPSTEGSVPAPEGGIAAPTAAQAAAAAAPAPDTTAPVPATPAPVPETTPPDPTTPPLDRPITAVVREAPPIRQVLGFGYDSEEKLRGLYEISHRNMFGTGRYLGLQLRGSAIEYGASLIFREQGVFGGRYDLQGTAFGLDEERPAFAGRTVGVSAQLSRDITRATRLKYRYSLKDVNLSDSTIDYTGTTLRLAGLTAAGVHDTRDTPFDPRSGHYYALELQAFGNAIGSEAQFTKIYAQAFAFRRLGPRAVWAQAVRAGAAPTFGTSKSDPESTGDPVSGLPQSERFYAGGDTTLRGFGRDLVGPLDDQGDPLGGEALFLLNEELRFSIWRQLQGAVFIDVGNVYRTVNDFDLGDLRESAGAGLRLMTPIGPFRMEYSIVLDQRPDEDPGRFYISIGQAF